MPEELNGNVPPKKIPTILIMTRRRDPDLDGRLRDPNEVKYPEGDHPDGVGRRPDDWNHMDGVPWFGQPLIGNGG